MREVNGSSSLRERGETSWRDPVGGMPLSQPRSGPPLDGQECAGLSSKALEAAPPRQHDACRRLQRLGCAFLLCRPLFLSQGLGLRAGFLADDGAQAPAAVQSRQRVSTLIFSFVSTAKARFVHGLDAATGRADPVAHER